MRWGNALNIAKGQMAAEAARAKGEDVLGILVAFMDARFADTHREVGTSPYASELNDQVYLRCQDILLEVAVGGPGSAGWLGAWRSCNHRGWCNDAWNIHPRCWRNFSMMPCAA